MDLTRERNLAKQLGAAIARKRGGMGLTQEQVAEHFGVGNAVISRIERGAAIPTITRLYEFADKFECDVGELLFKTSDRKGDHAIAIERAMNSLNSKDREFLVGLVTQTAEHLRARGSERATKR